MKKIHLACGTNVINGWENLDRRSSLNSKIIACDLINKPFPYKEAEVDIIYHEHF